MRRLLNVTTITTILALVLPVAALANVTGQLTLSSGQILNLDTGAVVASGGDIQWNGGTITPQGNAKALAGSTFGLSGATTFNVLTQTELSALSFEYSSAAIAASSLAVNDIFAVHTNGGNYAGVLVTAQSGTSITIQFVTFESGIVSSGPTITQVLNNYGLVPPGFPNSGIAQGSLFIVKGSGLASATSVSYTPCASPCTQLISSAAPGLPTTSNGASVSVTVNGTTTHPAFYYAENIQLAVVMPSNTPTGAGTVTVAYNGQTSAPFNIQVVASAFGFGTYYGTSGNGLGLATNASNYALYNYGNSILPGTTIVLYGTGLGADAARDITYTPVAFSINGLAHIYIGGIDASIYYQGASGYPGLNEIDVTIPANTPTGCNVSVVGVSAAGVPTNSITLPIGNGPCSDPAFGTSGNAVSTLTGKSTVNTGFVFLDQSTAPAAAGSLPQVTDAALAAFQSYSGSAYGTAGGIVSIGGCVVAQNLTGNSTTGTTTGLNAGAISVNGPNGSATLTSAGSILPGYYEAQLASGFIPASGGSFTVTGAGGTDVGGFLTTINFPNPVSWTNQSVDATISRSAGAQVIWTGGGSSAFVIISGSVSSGSTIGSFTCISPVGAESFTVPSYILGGLPAGSGTLSVATYTNYTPFTAVGLDVGYAAGFVSFQINSTYQ